MKIKNPSNRAIENVIIFGERYSIDAEGTLENVPEKHARYWQENLHKFLILRQDDLELSKEEPKVEVPESQSTETETPELDEEVSLETGEETDEEVEDEGEVITGEEIESMTRKELDALALESLGVDTSGFTNKGEVIRVLTAK